MCPTGQLTADQEKAAALFHTARASALRAADEAVATATRTLHAATGLGVTDPAISYNALAKAAIRAEVHRLWNTVVDRIPGFEQQGLSQDQALLEAVCEVRGEVTMRWISGGLLRYGSGYGSPFDLAGGYAAHRGAAEFIEQTGARPYLERPWDHPDTDTTDKETDQ